MNDLGTLSQCLMDSDMEEMGRARRLRRRALAVSLVLEMLLVAAMLLWPLITPGVLPSMYILTPLPPYSGGGNAQRAHTQKSSGTDRTPKPFQFPQQNTAAPQNQNHNDSTGIDAPDFGPGVEGGTGDATDRLGPVIPDGTGTRDIGPRPPATAVQKPRKISIGVMEASLVYRVEPIYPPLALATRTSGEVKLQATIATDGKVKNLEVVSGNPLLVQAAVAAVQQWRYKPTLLNREPVEVETFITVNFVLN